jgi:two-component system sensor histidine kinase UhpB
MESSHARNRRYVRLFWRLFLPNAVVLTAACLLLIAAPPNGRVIVLVSGLAVMLVINVLLMRRAFAPLERLTGLMRRIDPLKPGQRLPVGSSESEVTEMTRAFNDMLDRLETERRESARRALSAQEAERQRVATELHDEVGQSLTAILLQLEHLARAAPDGMSEQLLESQESARSSLEEVRRIARRLRPEALDELGLRSALTNLSDRVATQASLGLIRKFDRDLPRLSPDAELVLYRVAQEGMTNAVRHAHASSLELRLKRSPRGVLLQVLDDGQGLEDGEEGGGTRGMRERALMVGADLQILTRVSGGVEVRLEVPVEERTG